MSELKPKPPLLRKYFLLTFLIVIGIAVLAVISIPNYHGYHGYPKNSCINNLRQIAGAKHSWALENRQDTNAIPTNADIAQYLKHSKFPVCPKNGKYTIGRVCDDPTCSIPGHVLPSP